MKHKGIICGILAAVCYGTNPFGALPLYEEGVNTASVLFYRFWMAVLMLAVFIGLFNIAHAFMELPSDNAGQYVVMPMMIIVGIVLAWYSIKYVRED